MPEEPHKPAGVEGRDGKDPSLGRIRTIGHSSPHYPQAAGTPRQLPRLGPGPARLSPGGSPDQEPPPSPRLRATGPLPGSPRLRMRSARPRLRCSHLRARVVLAQRLPLSQLLRRRSRTPGTGTTGPWVSLAPPFLSPSLPAALRLEPTTPLGSPDNAPASRSWRRSPGTPAQWRRT